ncbi:sigma-54-dependent transcriptional regulator [Mesoterricola sediminis]|uniref:Type 4 fimbriae expression regulatory protein PilR n=1 Tax=Mesoterricola sediminis TaxID=2927980 RepID=A0AA48KHZ5_9BACT|nr:sigma-54 dependent transcriptional regulator [Mesoterricola sediminis]BDU78848.1 type 4 fimbriae expression regulatory protein PilR [Mesoterricola sediminis]
MHPSAPVRTVLIVEDEPGFRDVLQMGLAPQGFDSQPAGGLAEACQLLSSRAFDAVVSDLRLKDGSGIDLLTWMKARGLETPVVIMTAYATTETTVQALNLGAVDFLTKTKNDIQELTKVLKGIFSVSETSPAAEVRDIGDLVGVGPTIRKVQALVGKVARADTTVLVTGESGTGKEIVARLIHRYSDRAKGPFVPVNCGALPEALLESELFGYEKGAFTGATGLKRGLFEEAEGGVIFLDEIGEIPLPLQVKLLRVLQERRVRRVGATGELPVDARVIGATNRDLRDRVARGQFRQDLYYRLNILHIGLPPLRERQEDLPVLVEHFLARFCRKLGKPPMGLSAEAMDAVRRYRFPGNVRELENLMERCVALNSGGPIGVDLFPDEVLRPGPAAPGAVLEIPGAGFDLEGYLAALKRHFLLGALERAEGNKTRAARLLGMSFRAYRYWLQEMGGAEAPAGAFPLPEAFPPGAAAEGEGKGENVNEFL